MTRAQRKDVNRHLDALESVARPGPRQTAATRRRRALIELSTELADKVAQRLEAKRVPREPPPGCVWVFTIDRETEAWHDAYRAAQFVVVRQEPDELAMAMRLNGLCQPSAPTRLLEATLARLRLKRPVPRSFRHVPYPPPSKDVHSFWIIDATGGDPRRPRGRGSPPAER